MVRQKSMLKYPEKDSEFDTYAKLKDEFRLQILFEQISGNHLEESDRMRVLSKDFKPNENWWKSKLTID